MTKPESSDLLDAAGTFDAELASYARLGELFLKTPLGNVKQLERANQTLADIAACEERLQAAGQRLVGALSAARAHQEQLATAVIAHVPALTERNSQLHGLMTELTELAGDVGAINGEIAKSNGEANKAPTAEHAREISDRVLGLASRAESLANRAREASLDELAQQAHALHQRLGAVAKKLQRAGESTM